MRRRLAILFFLLALAAAVAAAGRWRGSAGEMAALSAQRAALETELDTTRASLHKASLRFQAFRNSIDAVPDSVRMFGAGDIMQRQTVFLKKIVTLEGEERRIEIAIGRIATRYAEATGARRRVVLPLAALAVLLLGAGTVLFAAERARRLAP